MLEKKILGREGIVTPVILIILSVFFVFAIGLLSWSFSERKSVLQKERGTEALQVAEAGVDYYKWHLAHNEDDYKNGENWCCNNDSSSTLASCGGMCGPYVETYKDYDGNAIGEFELRLKSPVIGSTVMDVESTGKVYSDSSVTKTVVAKVGKRSLAVYSFLTDSPIWIGEGESTSGPLHSNGGIRFDGSCDAEVTSAVPSYDASTAHQGVTGNKPGVWGDADASCKQYWSFPEPVVDFDLFTMDMAKIKTKAQEGGIYLGPSGTGGYSIVFQSSGKVDIYRVDSVNKKVKYITDQSTYAEDYEGMNQTVLLGHYNMPANGLIFAEDTVWVQGTVNGRATLAASKFSQDASKYARIIINDNINYIARNGNNVLGLMSEGDIIVPRHAPTYLTIDAVMLSQKGHVYRREYNSHYVAQNIEVYGGVITDLYWTWSWVNSNNNSTIDGYRTTSTIYDNNLTFSPPPNFPTSENFEVLSWSEKK